MSKKTFLIVTVVFIGLAFVFVSAMVLLTEGRSKRWILYKLKIGGILLTLMTIDAGCRVRHATCYMGFRSNYKDITTGFSTGFSGRKLHNNYFSVNAGFGSDKYQPKRFGYESGVIFNRNLLADKVNYTLGPYINGNYRIGYLTDIIAEGNYNFSLNHSAVGNTVSLSAGISYPDLFFNIGISATGNFIYSNRTSNLSFYPSVRLFFSIPVTLTNSKKSN
jgi:hypothetical protein